MRTYARPALPLLLLVATAPAWAQDAPRTGSPKKVVTDAVVDLEFRHDFEPLEAAHGTRVRIDRHHPTIYASEGDDHGAHAMLDILSRDGFDVSYVDGPLDEGALVGDLLIIHGLPSEKVEIDGGDTYWKTSLTTEEVDAVVRFVAGGGGLFLTQSHAPNGGGALLDAFGVRLRDGYVHHSAFPSFTDPEAGICSHFFGLSRAAGHLRSQHPLLRDAVAWGLEIERIDFLCGAAVFRRPEDVVLAFPPGTRVWDGDEVTHELSDFYAGLIAFPFGQGRVVVATDQGLFRNFIFTFDEKEKVHVTLTSPDNDNADLFLALVRWLSPKISPPAG